VYPALWTPTDASGAVDGPLLEAQMAFLRAAGVDGLMVLGSTGEFVHLELTVREEVLRKVGEWAAGWPVLANCSDIHPGRVARLGRVARETGAAAISLLPPWFFPYSDEDVVEHLVRGAEAAGLPLVLYNFPERTGHRLRLEMIEAVCDRVRVVGIKQSGSDFGYHRDLAALGQARGFTVITGADTRVREAYALGARGVVSGLSNAAPEWVVGTYRCTGTPALEAEVEMWETNLRKLSAAVSGLTFPMDVSAAMIARGRPVGVEKAAWSKATRERHASAVEAAREVFGPLAGALGVG
jgi:4-hydroxy-tetrahydrodipicolinate synthase